VELCRDELYRMVWAEPVEKLAARYGISGRGLAKICGRLAISVPPRGYWAQLQHGHTPEPVPLPPASRGVPTTVTLRGHAIETTAASTLPPDTLADVAREQQPEHRIRVPERVARFHPRVQATRAALHGRTPDKYGLVRPFTPRDELSRIPLLDICVARASVPRALRVVDTLLKALEARGFVSRDSAVRIRGETIAFGIRESVRQRAHVPTPKEVEEQRRWSWHRPPRWDYAPAGTLALKIDEFTRAPARKTWSDRPNRPLEERLNDIVAGMVLVADAKRRDEEERRREQEAYEAAERRRLKLERQRQEEEARRRNLHAQADRWASSRRLRRYLDAFERAATERGDQRAPSAQQQQWLTWARRYAHELDPLTADLPYSP
jgi:hypothetical protein